MNKKVWIPIIIFLFIVIVALVLAVIYVPKPAASSTALDAFAKCLSQSGAIMYGAYWCPHCQEQKALFGASFQYVNYVECTKYADKCVAAGIKELPTWIFLSGKTYEGTQSLQQLASESSCVLPAGK